MSAHETVGANKESSTCPRGWHCSAGEWIRERCRRGKSVAIERRKGGDSSRSTRCVGGENDTGMLVLEKSSAESNRVICPCVRAAAKPSADTIDTDACCDLALDDSAGSRYFCFDMLVISKLNFYWITARRGRWVERDSSNLRKGQGRPSDGDRRSCEVRVELLDVVNVLGDESIRSSHCEFLRWRMSADKD